MRAQGERGATLAEVLAAAGIAAIVACVGVGTAAHIGSAAAHADSAIERAGAVDRLSERLDSEAAGAWAVYVPQTDALGASNADGHAVAMYAQDGAHRPYGWQWVYDAGAHQVTRIAYDPAHVSDTAVRGDVIPNVDAFHAAQTAAAAIASPSSGAYDLLFAGASVSDVRVPFAGTDAAGGNGAVALSIRAGAYGCRLLLASGTAPSTFTMVIDFTPSPAPSAAPAATPGPISTPQAGP